MIDINEGIKALEKKFGKGTFVKLGKMKSLVDDRFSSGCFTLDIELGGGWPRGRIIEIFGPESCGKSFMCAKAVAEVQKLGGTVWYIDTEHSLDPDWLACLGVDVDKLDVSQPDSGEQALDIVETAIRANVDLVVLDSIAATVPLAEIEGDMEKQHMGIHARLMNKGIRKMQSAMNSRDDKGKHPKTSAMLVNQVREKIGVMYGNPETTTGGRGTKFAASIRLEMKRREWIIEKIASEDRVVGQWSSFRTVKNKTYAPYREGYIGMYNFDTFGGVNSYWKAVKDFKKGQIDNEYDIGTYAVKYGLVHKGGSWYTYKDKKYQGIQGLLDELNVNPEQMAELKSQVMQFAQKGNNYGIAEVAEKAD